jgi:hypothetical protein
MKRALLSLVLAVFLFGCKPMIKIFFGAGDPKPEDYESLNKYYHRKGINTANMLVFSDSIKYYERIREVKSFPEIRVFNKEGYLINYKDTSVSCSGSAYGFTDSICLFSNLKSNSSKNLITESVGLLNLDKTPFLLPQKSEYDYCVFIYTARFLGRLNKNHVKVWQHNLDNAKGCKVKYYLVDMDWQKSWDEKQ